MIESKLKSINGADVKYMEIGGRKVVETTGNMQEEYQALREGMMFYDCSTYGMLTVSGADADDFLEKISTKDIQYLNVGNVSECYFLNDDAAVIGSVFVLRREDDFFVIVPWEQADAVKEWLEKQADGEDVIIQDIQGTKALTQIEGPQSWKVIKKIFDIEVENIALRSSEVTEWNGEEITIIRIGRSSEYGYMMLSSFEKAEELFQAYNKEEWDFPVKQGGFEALELSMLEVHQPNFLRETSKYGNVFELAQQWYIQFDKEDYVGYEKLMEQFHAGITKTAVGFTAEKASDIASDAKVYVDDECIGTVVYAKDSFKLGKKLGIAVLNKPYAVSGLKLSVKTADGTKEMETISGPFLRPLSWDMKME